MGAGEKGIQVLYKVREADRKPNIADYIPEGKIDLVVNIPLISASKEQEDALRDEYTIRRLATEYNIPILTNLELASALLKILREEDGFMSPVCSLNEYMENLSWNRW
jgi:carbamoyl-phosphate synthase large subunit